MIRAEDKQCCKKNLPSEKSKGRKINGQIDYHAKHIKKNKSS